jgi:hypothetical protein
MSRDDVQLRVASSQLTVSIAGVPPVTRPLLDLLFAC